MSGKFIEKDVAPLRLILVSEAGCESISLEMPKRGIREEKREEAKRNE